MKKNLEVTDFVEILEREVTPFGNGAHVTLPKKHAGKKAIVIIQ